MNTNAANNASSSDATSNKPLGDESAYLHQQADYAQAAIKQALEDLKSSLAKGVDVRLWAKEHPWGVAALATAAGFAIASAAIPSKRQQELKRWIAVERAATAVHGNGDSHKETAAQTQPQQAGFLTTMGKEALHILRPALIGLLSSAVTQYTQGQKSEHEQEQNMEPPQY